MPSPPVHPAVRLRTLELQARKRFGQNFLVRPDAIELIVRAAGLGPGGRALEIGPGLGSLTRALLDTGCPVRAVELDRDLAAVLREDLPALDLVEGDALRLPLDEMAPGGGWTAVANLPYNVGTLILLRLLGEPARFGRLVLMFQREVGDRLEAKVGEEAFGALSVQVQARARVSHVLDLPPEAFHPRPKIWSVVLRFDPFPEPDFGRGSRGALSGADFDRAVRAGFSQRRKTLQNALSSLYPKAVVQGALASAGIDPSRRAETLQLEEWRRLAPALTWPGP